MPLPIPGCGINYKYYRGIDKSSTVFRQLVVRLDEDRKQNTREKQLKFYRPYKKDFIYYKVLKHVL